jgi:hypothetical protein
MALLDSTLTSAARGPVKSETFPNPHDNVSIIRVESYAVNEANYTPFAIGDDHPDNPVGTPDETFFYLMSESSREFGPGGIIRFSRVWHNVWTTRDDYETFAFSHPSLQGRLPKIDYGTNSNSTAAGFTTVVLLGDHDMAVGDGVSVNVVYTFTQGSSLLSSFGGIFRTITSTPASNQVAFVEIPVPTWADSFEVTSVTDLGGKTRDSFTRVVNSRVAVAYYILGVSAGITDPSDIPIIQKYTATGETGADVDYFSVFTTPTQATYLGLVTGATEIAAEASNINHIGGNLYERRTRYVTAA